MFRGPQNPASQPTGPIYRTRSPNLAISEPAVPLTKAPQFLIPQFKVISLPKDRLVKNSDLEFLLLKKVNNSQ